MALVLSPKSLMTTMLRLLAALWLVGCPQMGRAAGTWSVISLPQQPGEVHSPAAMAAGAVSNLYVADDTRIQERDAQGNWSVITPVGEVPSALAVDTAGNLYIADLHNRRIEERDAQGNWSVLATRGLDLGQIYHPTALAVDAAGNLYVAEQLSLDGGQSRLQKRDAQGNWSVIATAGSALGQVNFPGFSTALAVDAAGNLYVADYGASNGNIFGRIQKRDAQGSWSVIATEGTALGRVWSPSVLAVDGAANLYVADDGHGIQRRDAQGSWSLISPQLASALAADTGGDLYVADLPGDGDRIRKRDAQGKWSLIASGGSASGQIHRPSALAVDTVGNLYVADQFEGGRIQKRDARGTWTALATHGFASGQVDLPTALAVEATVALYVADGSYGGRIQQRDAQANWSVIAAYGTAPGQVWNPFGLAMDSVGNLCVADAGNDRIQQRDAQGNWSLIAPFGTGPGQVAGPRAIAADAMGSLYIADLQHGIQKRDAQGNWSPIASGGEALGQVVQAYGMAVDTAGNLYVADWPTSSDNIVFYSGRIQRRDAHGNWSALATMGDAPGQVFSPIGVAVDRGGNLYVADTGNNRVQEYMPRP
jgi:tripartite motif-containing protein 71